jgi:hypothetical protein
MSDGGQDRAFPPDAAPEYTTELAIAWYKRYVASGADEKAFAIEGAKYRASWAGSCTRQLQYKMSGQPETDPSSAADAWRMQVGTAVHDMVQPVLVDAFPGAEIEKKVDLSVLGIPGAAHLDVWIPREEEDIDGTVEVVTPSTAIEIKSINGFGYKKAATTFNRQPPEGPRFSARVQGALAAKALDADRMKVLYLSLENLSPSVAAKAGLGGEIGRFAAEWSFSKEEYTELADAEVARVREVLDDIHKGKLSRRYDPGTMPEGALVTSPDDGSWILQEDGYVVGTGRTWQCDYCSFRARCLDDGPSGNLRYTCPKCDGDGFIDGADCGQCGGTGGVPF